MKGKKNLCAMLPESLHAKVRQEQERTGKTLNKYMEDLLTEYYAQKGAKKMAAETRTMAIQLPEELFDRLKEYLKKEHLSQRQFIIDLIETALSEPKN